MSRVHLPGSSLLGARLLLVRVDGVRDAVGAALEALEHLLELRRVVLRQLLLEALEVRLDLLAVLLREKARVLLEALLRGVDEPVRVVAQLGELLLLLVVALVRLRVGDHRLDLRLAEAGVAHHAHRLLLAGAQVLGAHVHDAVGVDVERDLDLRHAARRGRDAHQLEARERLVVRHQLAIAERRAYVATQGRDAAETDLEATQAALEQSWQTASDINTTLAERDEELAGLRTSLSAVTASRKAATDRLAALNALADDIANQYPETMAAWAVHWFRRVLNADDGTIDDTHLNLDAELHRVREEAARALADGRRAAERAVEREKALVEVARIVGHPGTQVSASAERLAVRVREVLTATRLDDVTTAIRPVTVADFPHLDLSAVPVGVPAEERY